MTGQDVFWNRGQGWSFYVVVSFWRRMGTLERCPRLQYTMDLFFNGPWTRHCLFSLVCVCVCVPWLSVEVGGVQGTTVRFSRVPQIRFTAVGGHPRSHTQV